MSESSPPASYVLYALQHVGHAIPPQSDCSWIGEIGPGLDAGCMPAYGNQSEAWSNGKRFGHPEVQS